jgi:glycosyltransferase involved in cell wall biosynthesis
VLAAALARLPPGTQPWRWVLVGEGPWRGRLSRTIATAGLASRIMMPGRLDDARLHACYEAADLFVHPTLYEGSSLVTLEAMAHGAPVVATRAGGLPDKVRPGENGWLVTPGHVDELAAALEAALAEPDRRAAYGARSRAIVEREFAWPAVAAATLTLYRALLPTAR